MSIKKPKKVKPPWPTKKAMEQIYDLNLWGSNDTKYYSGFGSHNSELVHPYIKIIYTFLSSFKEPLTVCDLGCGDFNIGKQLYSAAKNYIAVDIVSSLIAYNSKIFKADNLKFVCLDIAKDSLPKADCVILRQVLQHLSNAEVQKVVAQLSDYKYIILTEHLPNETFIPNKDIISGQGIRIKKNSGLDILQPPFSFKAKTIQEMVRHDLKNNKGVIVTWLLEVF